MQFAVLYYHGVKLSKKTDLTPPVWQEHIPLRHQGMAYVVKCIVSQYLLPAPQWTVTYNRQYYQLSPSQAEGKGEIGGMIHMEIRDNKSSQTYGLQTASVNDAEGSNKKQPAESI